MLEESPGTGQLEMSVEAAQDSVVGGEIMVGGFFCVEIRKPDFILRAARASRHFG